jgi:hypothetical protein
MEGNVFPYSVAQLSFKIRSGEMAFLNYLIPKFTFFFLCIFIHSSSYIKNLQPLPLKVIIGNIMSSYYLLSLLSIFYQLQTSQVGHFPPSIYRGRD